MHLLWPKLGKLLDDEYSDRQRSQSRDMARSLVLTGAVLLCTFGALFTAFVPAPAAQSSPVSGLTTSAGSVALSSAVLVAPQAFGLFRVAAACRLLNLF